jgi:hypothetical protein
MGCCGSNGANGQAELDKSKRDKRLDGYVEGLSPEQVQRLAEKVYALLRHEVRIETDRTPAPALGR